MSTKKKMYMQILFDTKNKDTVDRMTYEEFLAYYHMLQVREKEV